ncbi:hypothetical protein PLESTB_001399700 [Pleodorina starrii]|uniref:Phosphoglycerate mutase n=1 Tax=Pleodorina starrii TaxID=330485 RepID=A0A9W6BVE6_9CHLO|nr:hypothetical protein PLESTB_001399700 [Pleodorina starrii]GLC68705.1 hypothetical protein PLESTF_000726500 [Pleodorina starrii]
MVHHHHDYEPQRYLLVMRHAQRQDEVDDGWAATESARPGGRPWDPPLSSPQGLAQAEEAAAKLAAWERRTGARIVAVVASPFLRCLQTAAAACRQLGLHQLHVSWAVSEALCRMAAVPPGPLPSWMWPRAVEADGQSGAGGDSSSSSSSTMRQGMSPGEFLTQLGAEVVEAPLDAAGSGLRLRLLLGGSAAAQLPGDGTAPAQERRGGRVEARPGLGEQREEGGAGGEVSATAAGCCSEGAQRCQPDSAPRVLQGLRVTVLPPPLDLAAVGAAPPGDTAAGGDGPLTAAGLSPPSPPESESESAPDSCRHSLGEGGDGRAEETVRSSMAAAGEAVSRERRRSGPDALPGEDGGSSGKGEGCGEAPGRHWPRGRDHRGGQGVEHTHLAAAAAAPLLPEYGVPYAPETLEAAHVRYRAAIRCLMAAAAAAAAAAGPAATAEEPAAGDGSAASTRGAPTGTCCGESTEADAMTARVVAPGPTTNGSIGGAHRPSLAPWRALWQAGTTRRTHGVNAEVPGAGDGGAGAGGASGAPSSSAPMSPLAADEQAPGGRPEDHSPGPSAQDAAAGGFMSPGNGGERGGRTEYDKTSCCGDESEEDDADDVRQFRRQPISQLDTPPHDGAFGPVGRRHTRHRKPPREGTVEAVLVVTHGEAVACAAATVAPWALVYEVRHTGFVVLAAGEGDGEEEAGRHGGGMGDGARSGEGGSGADAVWELLPDPHGHRGVLWMSALDE